MKWLLSYWHLFCVFLISKILSRTDSVFAWQDEYYLKKFDAFYIIMFPKIPQNILFLAQLYVNKANKIVKFIKSKMSISAIAT